MLLPTYLLISQPSYLLAQEEQTAREISAAVAASLKPAPLEVKVNRTLPAGVMDDEENSQAALPENATPLFSSANPKDGAFFAARFFEEPLVPTEGKPAAGENQALAQALKACRASTDPQTAADPAARFMPVKQFLADHPRSRWTLALSLNLGLSYRKAGYWTRALDAWEQAWSAGKAAAEPKARALADRAVAELAELNARLGRYERLAPLFAELDAARRTLRGAASDKLAGARQGLWMMDNQPDRAFRCGPMALGCLAQAQNPGAPLDPKIFDASSTRRGIALSQVAALSRDTGRPMQMAYRAADKNGKGAEFLIPAVVHWKAGHYAALAERKGGRYRVDDPTFGDTLWVGQAALEAETDGYFLVDAKQALASGWRAVDEAEGGQVWGKGVCNGRNPNATRQNDIHVHPSSCSPGMATYNVEAMLTSLTVSDTPLSYAPPRGTPVDFSLKYSQHEASQPAVFTSWNFGPKWTSQWSSYVEDNGTAQWVVVGYDSVQEGNTTTEYPIFDAEGGAVTGLSPVVHLAGGGVEGYPAATQLNSFNPPGDAGPYIFFSFDAPDQTLAYFNPPLPPSGWDPTAPPSWWPPGVPYQPFTADPGPILWSPGTPFKPLPGQGLAFPRLVQIGDTNYQRNLPDGSVESYGQSDGRTHYPRRIFLTKRTDPAGNATRFFYDSHDGQQRLRAVKDALDQVTTLSYELATDPLKVTKVTDPFGRSCQLAYNDQGQLQSITDTAGIQSSFGYQTGSDFINSLTTPYGTTAFAFGDASTDPALGTTAWLEATDPYGDKERTEFNQNPGVNGLATSETAPAAIPTFNNNLFARNSFYWDKKAYQGAHRADGSFDYTQAKLFHFLHGIDTSMVSGTLESTKAPLENRVWLFYQGQISAGFANNGMCPQPSVAARLLDDGSTQLSKYQYNLQNHLTQATDPLGRVTSYDYDPKNQVDLLGVRCTTGGLNEQLFSATYNDRHQPLTTTDAAGQTTVMTYNGLSQLHSVTDPAQRTVTFQYNSPAGYLQEIDGFDPAIKSVFGYDGFGRLSSATAYPDAYTVAVGYDAVGGDPRQSLNRPATATFPDGSYTEVDYASLDPEWTRDRGGNWTHLLTNKLRQTVASIDPLGQVTQFGYCKCGQLVKIIDPNGNVTQWKLDAAARPYAKVYADGTEVGYTYEQTTSRLKQVTDARQQTTTYNYCLDGALQSVAYAGSAQPTPGVGYTYDPQRGRLATVTDGIGTTTYSYYPLGSGGPGALGAGRVQSVSGPFPGETAAYRYDSLGRTTTRTVNGVDESYGFDPLGRLQSDTNALGTFTYGYDGVTGRLSSVGYPNGQTAALSYIEDSTQDKRLAQIKHFTPSGAVLDQFDYTYDGPQGRIAHWGQQQPGATAGASVTSAYDLTYDSTGQLKRAVLNGDSTSSASGVWSYDAAGNRTGEQSGSGTLSTAVPTPTNALFSLSGGGAVRVAGSLSEWANVSVNGQAASVDAGSNTFEAFVPLTVGQQTVSITATDAGGNAATSRYQLAISAGAGAGFGYDDSGNTVAVVPSGGGSASKQGFEWDACNRVVAINQGSHRTEFGYDGAGKRVRITEKDGGSVTTDRLYVANEERDAATGQVLRRLFTQGEQRVSGSNLGAYYYANDHLGSTRELTDSAGNVRASYGYTLWGSRTTLQAGGVDTESGFTGYWHHAPSGLDLSATRLYSPAFGRFISKDPLQESGGLNLYRYCGNNPASRSDPSGLVWGMDWLDNSAYDGFFQGAADFSSGFGSVATFGLSDWYEDGLGLTPSINKCSWSYKGGEAAAFLAGLLDGESEEEGAAAAERCLFGCFAAGTLIDTAKGKRPVESVQQGDLVWSKDVGSGTPELRPVTNTFHRTSADEVDVVLTDSETIQTTPEHPFWVAGLGWCPAAKLAEGERLLTEDQHETTIESVSRQEGGSVEVYNLELEHSHTYFVGKEKVLVHNVCSGEAVWDSIKATQPEWEGTVIPRSFELATESGSVWVHGNATEHLAEYATSMLNRGVSTDLVSVASQAQLGSLQTAVKSALSNGIQYNQLINAGGWELKFAAARQAGQLPALIHAMLMP